MVRAAYHTTLVGWIFLLQCACGGAADVNLNGVVGNKALLVIDNAKPRWLAVGDSSPQGIKLISISGDTAVVEEGGKRQTLKLGESRRLNAGAAATASGNRSVKLNADGRGHFVTTGQINGQTVRFLVDTGASFVSLSSSEAKRLGLNYLEGDKATISTANGLVRSYKVKLDEVRLGDVTLNNVDGMVHADDSLPIVLLGMSFLNRMEMTRDGEQMVLKKRF
jgi:aspartyl protease family protein